MALRVSDWLRWMSIEEFFSCLATESSVELGRGMLVGERRFTTGWNVLSIVNTILLEDVLQVSIRVVIFIGGPQTAQIDSRVCSIVQGTRGPLVLAVGNNTSLKCGH